MIRELRLADQRGRDATCLLLPIKMTTERRQWQDLNGQPVYIKRRVKVTHNTHPDVLLNHYPDPEDMARALIDGDPEWDYKAVGRPTGPCMQQYLDGDGQPCYAPKFMQIRYDANGLEKERRPVGMRSANLVSMTPPVWSGMLLPRQDIIHRMAFSRIYQVVHQDALQFDFLYEIAKYLQQHNVMVQVGSGRQGRGPLICERNGKPYRGFLDGHVSGDAMRLILYLAAGELQSREVVP